jgi:hypothetical protein
MQAFLFAKIGVALASICGAAQGREAIPMSALTATQDRLPAGCALTPNRTERFADGRILGGLWGGLPIPANPWSGMDRPRIATIRERIDGPPLTPDAPPLTRAELARFRMVLADGVDEGYAAFYRPSQGDVIGVYGLKFKEAETNRHPPSRSRSQNLISIGLVTAFVAGNDSPCFRAVSAHVQSLAP